MAASYSGSLSAFIVRRRPRSTTKDEPIHTADCEYRSIKSFEAMFFALFLVLYYAVLVERKPEDFSVVEGFLYVWIAAFAYDEFGEFQDAGSSFYGTDFWSLWDLGIIGIGFAYMISSESSKYDLPLQRSRPSVEEDGARHTQPVTIAANKVT